MKTIKSSGEITTLEVGDKVVFGDIPYVVRMLDDRYYLYGLSNYVNDYIIEYLSIDVLSFNRKLGITCQYDQDYYKCGAFPEYYSLEALTAVVTALLKEYEKQMSI